MFAKSLDLSHFWIIALFKILDPESLRLKREKYFELTESLHGRVGGNNLIFKGPASLQGGSGIVRFLSSYSKGCNDGEILNGQNLYQINLKFQKFW